MNPISAFPFFKKGVRQSRPSVLATSVAALLTGLAGLASTSFADSLTTTYVGGNNHRGNMFDITSTTGLEITGFEVNILHSTTIPYAIYYHTGTWVGTANSPQDWTLLQTGTVSGTVGSPSDLISLSTQRLGHW